MREQHGGAELPIGVKPPHRFTLLSSAPYPIAASLENLCMKLWGVFLVPPQRQWNQEPPGLSHRRSLSLPEGHPPQSAHSTHPMVYTP